MIKYDFLLKEHHKDIKKFLARNGGELIVERAYPWYSDPPGADRELMKFLYESFSHLETHRGPGVSGMAGSIPGPIPYRDIDWYGREVIGLSDVALTIFTESIMYIDKQSIKAAIDRMNDKSDLEKGAGTEAE